MEDHGRKNHLILSSLEGMSLCTSFHAWALCNSKITDVWPLQFPHYLKFVLVIFPRIVPSFTRDFSGIYKRPRVAGIGVIHKTYRPVSETSQTGP